MHTSNSGYVISVVPNGLHITILIDINVAPVALMGAVAVQSSESNLVGHDTQATLGVSVVAPL